MKTVIIATVISISTVVSAQPIGQTPALNRAATRLAQRQDKLALAERMGQLQLDLLVGSIVQHDETAHRGHTRGAEESAQR